MLYKLFYFLVSMRPKYWIPVLIFLILGSILATKGVPNIWILLSGLLIFGPLGSGATYLLNQYFDYSSDLLNKRFSKMPIASGKLKRRYALLGSIILFVVGIYFSFQHHLHFFILYTIEVVLSILYSVPPILLKARAMSGFFTNGIGYGIIPLSAGWSLFRDLTFEPFLFSIPIFFGMCAAYLYKAVEDIDTDIKFDTMTIAVKFGKFKTIKLISVLCSLAYTSLLILVILKHNALWFLLLTFPVPLFSFYRLLKYPNKTNMRRIGWILGILFIFITISMIIALG